jgi:hypothetical protein
MVGRCRPTTGIRRCCSSSTADFASVGKLKQQGRSLDETIATKPSAAFDAKWGQFVITPEFFTRLVYQGV